MMRRMAIQIMDKVRKDRAHDVLLAGVARWIAEVEVKGLDESGGVVTRDKMPHEIELDFDAVEGSCKVAGWWRRVDESWEGVTSLISNPDSETFSVGLIHKVVPHRFIPS
jgi:hypothetical protein